MFPLYLMGFPVDVSHYDFGTSQKINASTNPPMATCASAKTMICRSIRRRFSFDGFMWFYGVLWWFNGILWDLMGFNGIYPLVNIQKTIWKNPPLKQWVNPLFLWTIFHSKHEHTMSGTEATILRIDFFLARFGRSFFVTTWSRKGLAKFVNGNSLANPKARKVPNKTSGRHSIQQWNLYNLPSGKLT